MAPMSIQSDLVLFINIYFTTNENMFKTHVSGFDSSKIIIISTTCCSIAFETQFCI